MAEKLEELQLPRAQVEIESRGAIYAVPFFEDTDLGKPSQSPEDALGPGAWHPSLATSVSSGHPTSAFPFPTALAIPEAGVPLSCGAELEPIPCRGEWGDRDSGVRTVPHWLVELLWWCQGWDTESTHRKAVPGSQGEVRDS